MENELSTVIYKINFRYILKNYLNKELWKKQWTLFDYNNVVRKMRIKAIDIASNKIILAIDDGGYYYSFSPSFEIPLSEAHFSEKVFTDTLFRTLWSDLVNLERSRIRKLDAYEMALTADYDLKDRRKEIAEEFLDDNNVTNETIREAYIDHFVDSFEDDDANADRVLAELKYKVTPELFLMLSLQYEKEDQYQEVIDRIEDEDVEELKERLKQDYENFDVDDMTVDAKEHLEEI